MMINLQSQKLISNYVYSSVASGFRVDVTDVLPAPVSVSENASFLPPLGNNVNLQALSPDLGQLSMIERYRLLALSKRILSGSVRPGHNILGCQRVAVYGASTIGLTRSVEDLKKGFHFSGVKTCKSSWVCPVCSYALSGARANEVRKAITATKKAEGDVYMLTLTFRHSRFDNLADLLGKCKKALVKMWGQKVVKQTMKKRFVGRITATELTYSDGAGWHPHQHILLLGAKGLSCESLQAVFGEYWIRALISCGLSGVLDVACEVQPASAVQDYLTKMSSELALGNTGTKQGREGHYSPFQLLGMCRSRSDYETLWREFYSVTRGKQCLAWSRGLKRICGITERSDEQILECSESERFELVLSVFAEDWKELLTYDDLGFIRRASSVDAVLEVLDRRGARYEMAVKERD